VTRSLHFRRLILGLVACVASQGAMRTAYAAPPPVALSWEAKPGCMTAEELRKAVDWTLGRPAFRPDAEATISGRVSPRASGGYEAVLAMRASDEDSVPHTTHVLAERTLTAATSCRELDDGMAVVVALMIDALGDEPVVLRRPERGPPLALSRSLLGGLDLGGGLTYGLLPAAAGMAALRGELTPPLIPPLAVTLRLHAPSSTSSSPAGGTFSAWDAELAACPGFGRGRLRVGACGGIGAGTLEGSPTGQVLAGTSIVRPLVLVSALPYGALRLGGNVWLRADAGVLVPLLRDTWGFEGPGGYVGVFHPAVAIPLGSLSVELRTGS